MMQTSVGTSFLTAMGGKPPVAAGKTVTENGAVSLATTGMARVNLFFKMCRGMTEAQLAERLEASWTEDPLDTLKVVFQARDCRGGKGERLLFRQALSWLADREPAVVLANMDVVPEYGRWEDLLWFIEFGDVFAARVAEMFADQLRKDRELMDKGEPCSLAAKWAPTEGRKHDKKTHAASLIRSKLECSPRQYRTHYLTPLRAYLRVVEGFMCKQEWSEIDYSKVPSVAMNRLKKAFKRNDEERFEAWKAALVSGTDPKVKVNASQVFLHDLVRPYMGAHPEDVVTEKQWEALVAEGVALKDSIVLSDVSGSMYGTPMEVSIALGIFISEMTAEPFRNQVITFESCPRFFHLTGKSLYSRVKQLKSAPWGGTTDFQAVFNLILERALGYEQTAHGKAKVRDAVPPEMMPKRLFVLSDMQFNIADAGGNFMTNYEVIKSKYAAAGYPMPAIVFWNLRGNTCDFPVNAMENGVSMVSGFSQDLLKAVVRGKDMSPYGTMRSAIDDERYDALKLE